MDDAIERARAWLVATDDERAKTDPSDLVYSLLDEIAKMKAQVPPPKPCGGCGAPLGAKFYSDTPTVRGKLDLCLACWTNRGDLEATSR